ncbi:hypothetical protein Syun_027376 [Stephania yunnanensis]|uniref:ER membrane protein complex subunit 6 n=1 Tax=Stephania yunnanensis TaxID=152371 RepID=A0AAP0EHT7_9MAGN
MGSGHDEKNRKADVLEDLGLLNVENLQNNMKIIYYSRTFLSIIGGVIAGILGVTGVTGFICYFLIMAIASLGFVAKADFSIKAYFNSWNQIMLDGFLSGLMSFVLFWTYPSRWLYFLKVLLIISNDSNSWLQYSSNDSKSL